MDSKDTTLQATTARVPRAISERLRVAWQSNPAQLSRGKLVTEALREYLPEFEQRLQQKRVLVQDTSTAAQKRKAREKLVLLAGACDMTSDTPCDVLSVRLPPDLKRRATFIYRNDDEAEFRSVAHVIASALDAYLRRFVPAQAAA
jgi:hypothetical protein